ncbi:hypothetical protein F441_14627 [Phytophthora nicotianae CJ01A1]|uniref:Uncharacterized protein n=2 Tax=Phytophthora nicotianae TaxID=4792 RepID=V9EL13_PHYNI|nr:hypothetical protein F443_14792 [Phytophthora nicotianae P1569]ETP09507.1 hypothetical protein F441_14627 [Phytophthora nicotianae CJ01A1]
MAPVRFGDLKEYVVQSCDQQRGLAAHMRQADDNLGRTLFKRNDRQFLNKVIHDASMDHRPEYDKRLKQLAKLIGVIDADATHHDVGTDHRFKRLEQENRKLKRQLEFALTELKNYQDNFTKLKRALEDRALEEVRFEFECKDCQRKLKILMAVLAVLILVASWDFVILIPQWIILILQWMITAAIAIVFIPMIIVAFLCVVECLFYK